MPCLLQNRSYRTTCFVSLRYSLAIRIDTSFGYHSIYLFSTPDIGAADTLPIQFTLIFFQSLFTERRNVFGTSCVHTHEPKFTYAFVRDLKTGTGSTRSSSASPWASSQFPPWATGPVQIYEPLAWGKPITRACLNMLKIQSLCDPVEISGSGKVCIVN